MGGYYLKLRNNIILDSDLQLAEKEIHNLFGECIPISQSNVKAVSFIDAVRVKSNTRNGDIIGYLVSSPVVPIHRCAILLSFIQEIWCEGKECGLNDGTYTISLSVTGDSEFTNKINVVVVFDKSGSMSEKTPIYTETDSTDSGLYGIVDGEYVPLERRGNGNNRTFWFTN